MRMHHPKVGTNHPELGIILGEGPWVYFIQSGLSMDSPIKIGHTSRHLKERMSEINISSSSYHLIAALPGGEPAEKRLHKLFETDRIRGEWFRQTADLLYMIHIMIQEAGTRDSKSGNYLCIKMMKRTVEYWYEKGRQDYDDILWNESECRKVLGKCPKEEGIKVFFGDDSDPFFLDMETFGEPVRWPNGT